MKHKSQIVILHGWKLSGMVYQKLAKLLNAEGYTVYLPDFPGFGKEPLIHAQMNLDDYVIFLNKYFQKEKIVNPVLIGHSFGGRVAIKYAYLYPGSVSKIILTGVPIVRNITIKKRIVRAISQACKKIILSVIPWGYSLLRKVVYKSIGEWDYYNSGNLKEIFKNVISEDLIPYFSKLRLPIYFIWGEKDTIVPFTHIHRSFPQVPYFTISKAGHSPLRDVPNEYASLVKKCL